MVTQDRVKNNVLCAWCGKELGWKDGLAPRESSHGICPACLEAIKPELAEELETHKPRLP